MYIEIKVFKGEDADSELYEKLTAHSLLDAEGELRAVERHLFNDRRRGIVTVCEACNNIITYGTRIVGEDDVEVEEGHNAECQKVTALV